RSKAASMASQPGAGSDGSSRVAGMAGVCLRLLKSPNMGLVSGTIGADRHIRHVEMPDDDHAEGRALVPSLVLRRGHPHCSNQVSLAPPPRDELTTMLPRGATRVSAAGTTTGQAP